MCIFVSDQFFSPQSRLVDLAAGHLGVRAGSVLVVLDLLAVKSSHSLQTRRVLVPQTWLEEALQEGQALRQSVLLGWYVHHEDLVAGERL